MILFEIGAWEHIFSKDNCNHGCYVALPMQVLYLLMSYSIIILFVHTSVARYWKPKFHEDWLVVILKQPLPTLVAIQLNMRIRRQLKILCRTLYLPLCCLALVLLIQTLRWLQHKQETQISDEDGIVLEEKKILYPFAIIFMCFYWYSFLWEIKCSVMVGSVTGISQLNVAQIYYAPEQN